DYLLRALDPLFQKEVIPMEEYNLRRGLFKKHIKRFYYSCRRFDEGLRSRMNAHDAATAKHSNKIKGNGSTHATLNDAAPVTRDTRPGVSKSRTPKAMVPADASDKASGHRISGVQETSKEATAQHALAGHTS